MGSLCAKGACCYCILLLLRVFFVYRIGGDVLDWLNWSELMMEGALNDQATLAALIKCQAHVTYSVKCTSKSSISLSVRRLWKRILKKVDVAWFTWVTFTTAVGSQKYTFVKQLSLINECFSHVLCIFKCRTKLNECFSHVLRIFKCRTKPYLLVFY